MIKAKIQDQIFEVNFNDSTGASGVLNGLPFELDKAEIKADTLHIIWNHQSFQVRIVSIDQDEKMVSLKVNGTKYDVEITTEMDQLLERFGFQKQQKVVDEIKSAMPGKVIKLAVQPGDLITESQTLLILEAMKMENIIKSPINGVVEKVLVHEGDSVNKGDILIKLKMS